MLFLGFLLCTVQSYAQYTATAFETGNQYTALTKDNSNNVYGVRLNFTTLKGEVVKFAAGSTTPTVIYNNLVFEAGLSQIYPWGIAVNSNGDVFVTSANQGVGWQIIKLTYPSYTASAVQTGRYFSALAVDASNNLYAMEYNSATVTYQLVRYAAGAESGAGTPLFNGVTYHPGASATYPWGIAFDSQNNIYLLDFWENSGGRLIKCTAPGYAASEISTNKSFSALAIDGSNNIYTIEGTSATTAHVMKYAGANMAAGTEVYNGLTHANLFYAWGLAATSDGKVFVGDAPAAPSGRLVQLAPPNITVSSVNRVGAASTNTTTTVQYTVTFSSSAANVTTGSFALTTTGGIAGASISGISGSGTTYTVTVNVGTGEGTIRLDVNGSGITPTVSNVPFTTGQVYTIDRTAPTTTIVSGPPTLTNSTSATFSFSSNETGTFETSIDGGGYITSTSPKTFTGLADGPHTFSVRAIDAAGNVDGTPESYAWTVDATAPNTTILTYPTNPTSSSTATFTFTSSESGSTFQGQLDGGGYATVPSPINYIGLADGSHTFNVRAVDAAGNIDGTPASYTWLIDAIPTVTSVSVPPNGYYRAGDVLSFDVTFNEVINVTGTPSIPVTIGSTTVQANYTGGSGSNALTFSYTVQAGENDMDGIAVGSAIQLNGGTIKDASNNAILTLNSVASTTSVFVNTNTPTVVLTSTAPAVVNSPFTINITFSEAVTILTVSDFEVTNATLSNLINNANTTFTVLVTPTSDGPITVKVKANGVVNIGGNPNTESNVISHTYDGTAPVVNFVAVPVNNIYHTGDVLNFIVRFNEDLVVNTTGGSPTLTLTIGSATVNAIYNGLNGTNGLNFSYTVVAGNNDMDGITVGNLVLNGGTIKDAPGNNANLTLNSVGNTTFVRVNTVIPTVSISSNATNPVTGPFTLTITFSEAVTGFVNTDISVTNATIGALSTTDNITYTATVTPAAGAISISVPANVAENVGLNGNSASNTLSLVFDTTPPTITSVTVPANGYYKAGNVLSFTVNFDENVTVTGTPSIPVTIGSTTVQANYTGGTGTNALTFAYTVVAGNSDMDGIALGSAVQLNGGTIKDVAANNANLTLNSVGNTTGVFVNTSIPWVVIGGSVVLNAPFTANVVFGEAVTGFDITDFQLTNATVSNLQTTDNITYTVLITPTAQGTVSVTVPANAAVNIGGNGNTASAPLTWIYDATSSVITSVTVPANGYYKAGDVLNFTVNFDENVKVTGAPTLPVIIGSTTVQAAYVSGTNTNALAFSYTVVDGDLDMDGITFGANLALNGGTIKDISGNDANLTINNAGNTTNVKVNTTHATVVLSTTAASRVNAPFTVTVTFSEAVTGLTASDFTLTNATVGTPQTTNNLTYTVVVTPTADGSASISLPADAAINVANNGTKASNTITVTRDATAPVITAAQNFNILQNSTAGTQIGQVAATDASGILQNFAITSDPTGGAFQISATGLISVKDMAILNNNVNSTINVLVTVSDGLNTSAATAVAIKINPINKAPVLDAINNVVLCATTNSQTIQLTGASAVEPTQAYTLSIASNQALFDVLTVNTAGLITYQLKPSTTSGVATITVTIKDNGGTANGGVDTYQRTFTITVNPLPIVNISSDKGSSVSKGEIVHLTATGGATYSWTATTNSILSGANDAIAEVRPQANTMYTVTATSSLGCKNTNTWTITTIEDFKVDATNVLTPNGDGKNDKWVIRNIDSYPDNELKIFDRSGRLVFSQRNYNNTWDGKVNGHPLAEGTYYYFLSISGGAKTAKGFITIITKAN